MHRIIKGLSVLSVLHVVGANRDGADDFQGSASQLHRDRLLQVENMHLRDEVTELRAELRVAASGAFVKKHKASASSTDVEDKQLAASTSHGNQTQHRGSVEEASALQLDIAPVEAEASTGVRPLLPFNLQDISEAIAQDAATVARTIEKSNETAKSRIQETNHSKDGHRDRKALFVIYSSSKYYDSRMRWVRDTWAKKLPSSQLVVIGDGKASNLEGVNFHQTRCDIHDHAMAISCKYAEAVIVAQTMMWQHPELEWAYLADDDSYIRAAQLERALLDQPPSLPLDRGLVLATFGCVTANCSDLLCSSSGYAANRWAIEIMAAGDPAGFVQEMMQNSKRCTGDGAKSRGPWGDGGLAEVIDDRGIERRTLDGIYGWMMDKSCLEYSLESEKEPLLYHMIRSRAQMEFLHRLFAPVEEQTGGSVPRGSGTALDGLGGCVEFRGNVQCAASRADEDRPWHRGPAKCTRPRMPRLPVLLGVFTLALLFIILITFIWAGVRYQQWEGWKLQGVKWHSHSMQGRSRFR